MRRAGLLFFLLTIGVAVPRLATAQPDVRRAQQLADEGLRLYRQAGYEQAIERFQESYRLVPDPNNLFNIGKCYERMNRIEEAIEAYRRYIVEAESAQDREEVQARVQNLENRPAHVTVSSNPPGATVWVDDSSGVPAGRTPLTIELERGNHVITIRLEGYEQASRPLQGGFGRQVNIDITMAPVSDRGGDGESEGASIEGEGRPRRAAHTHPLQLGAGVGLGFGTVGTDVTLTATTVIDLRLAYGIELISNLYLDIGASGSLAPRTTANPDAGVPEHSLLALTVVLEPALRVKLSEGFFLFARLGFGVMNLLGLKEGDEFLEPDSTLSGSLLTFLDTRFAGGLWVHVTKQFVLTATAVLDYSPAVEGVVGDFVHVSASAGVLYRF